MAIKNLVVQIQPDLLLIPNREQAIQDFIKFLGEIPFVHNCCISTGNEDGAYINIQLQSENSRQLWEQIQNSISLTDSDFSLISKGIVVVCEGDKGWSDYLQLYHYNKSEKLDLFNSKNV